MSALLIGYAIVGIVTWAGMIVEFAVGGHIWRPRDVYGLPVTMIGVTALWLPAIAFWQFRMCRKGGRS